MIICHSRKFIFFSNPKTGSETIRALLEPWSEEPIVPWKKRGSNQPFYPHMSPTEAETMFDSLGWNFRSYTRITTVRNPYDRLVSLYRMMREVDGLWQLRRATGLGTPSFANWLQNTHPNGRGGGGRPHQRWRKFGTWSAENWCADRVDHTIRVEHLEADLEPVLANLGISPGAAAHLNSRGKVNLSDWYDPQLSELVTHRYAWDMTTFGYDLPTLSKAA